MMERIRPCHKCYESIRKQINAYGNYTSIISNPIVSWVRKAGGNDMGISALPKSNIC